MANMCINFITITGDDLTKIREELKKANESNRSWLPEGLEGRDNMRWLFDLYIVNDYEDLIEAQCETKWSQPTEELEAIGKLFKVNITNLYEELSSCVYGFSEFNAETMETTETYLDEEDFERVVVDEDTNDCLLDGEFCECEAEALEQILEEKLKQSKKTYMVVDVSGRGFTTTHTFSQLKNWLGEEMTCDDELAIDAIDSLDVGDKFDCDNIIDSDSFTACHIIRTT